MMNLSTFNLATAAARTLKNSRRINDGVNSSQGITSSPLKPAEHAKRPARTPRATVPSFAHLAGAVISSSPGRAATAIDYGAGLRAAVKRLVDGPPRGTGGTALDAAVLRHAGRGAKP